MDTIDTSTVTMALHALSIIFDSGRIGFLVLGVLMGLVIGVIPGIGGLVGLSLLLPFTFTMDPYAAVAMMLGLLASTSCSDSIPSTLLGVPGTVGAAATILDGYPMARKGQAGRSLGAGFFASMCGGLIGATFLFISIPVMRPLVLGVGTPELLAICVFGLSLIAVLSDGMVLKGLAAAALGLLIATTGMDANTGTMRWTFDTLYLWEGVPLVPIALGLFALPELADLFVTKSKISGNSTPSALNNQRQGVLDVLRNKWLVVRCAMIGSSLGSIPGIGAPVIDWIGYGHAKQTEKNTEGFGSGDVRGVIASETSNSAKDGGALVPTIAFGVPGSAPMALLLGAFLIHNITPGPDMLGIHLDVTYTLIWSVALANVFAAGLCFMFASQFAKLASVPAAILLPIVLSVIFVGTYQASHAWGDFYVMFGFGALGWIMKKSDWPRPALILGLVLGPLIENYMFISFQRYDTDWLIRPAVVLIFTLTAAAIAMPMIRAFLRQRQARRATTRRGFAMPDRSILVTVAVIGVFALALAVSSGWPQRAQLVPQIICWGGLMFALGQLLLEVTKAPAGSAQASVLEAALEGGGTSEMPETGVPAGVTTRRTLLYAGWGLGFLGVAALVGLLPAILVFLVMFMRLEGRERWLTVAVISLVCWIAMWLLFQEVLHVHWPESLLGSWFPELRSRFGIF